MGTSTLADAFASERRLSGDKCDIRRIFAKLDKDDRALVEQWLADDEITSAHIARTLTRIGHTIQGQALARHRRGDCRCDDTAVG